MVLPAVRDGPAESLRVLKKWPYCQYGGLSGLFSRQPSGARQLLICHGRAVQDLSEATCTASDCVGEFCSVGGILKGGEGNKSVVPNKEEEKPKNFRPT